MKKSILAVLAIALFISMGFYATRPWDGDAWAAKQMTVTTDIIACVTLAKNNYPEFKRTCDPADLANRSKDLAAEILDVMNTYPPGTSTEYFLAVHFTDINAGLIAMKTSDVVASGLSLMAAYMARDNAIMRRDIEIEKAKKSIGVEI